MWTDASSAATVVGRVKEEQVYTVSRNKIKECEKAEKSRNNVSSESKSRLANAMGAELFGWMANGWQ